MALDDGFHAREITGVKLPRRQYPFFFKENNGIAREMNSGDGFAFPFYKVSPHEKHTRAMLSGGTEKKTTKIVLLPIEQSEIPKDFQIDPETLLSSLRRHCLRYNVKLAEYADVDDGLNEKLVDEAVFELLVTDKLDRTLALMDDLDQPHKHQRHLIKTASQMNISYLVRLHIQPDQTQIRLTWDLIDTAAGDIIDTKTTFDVRNDPTGTADQTAKQIALALWRQTQ